MNDAPTPTQPLRVLVVDDEAPARADLSFMLERDARIGSVVTAPDAATALGILRSSDVDGIFLDIRMPGLDGIELARAMRNLVEPPPVVFVTAHDDHAVEAFELRAVDYLLKPVRTERLTESVGRIIDALGGQRSEEGSDDDETIPVELAGVTRFVRRSEIRYVEAHGDYARLVTDTGRHLVRIPLSVLEERWAAAGFVRIHRRWLVSLAAIDEVRIDAGRASVRIGEATLEVSRRHTRELRDRLVRDARPRR